MDKLRRLLPTRIPELQTFFQSGSIIDSVLNFGLAAPINVQLSGQDYDALYPLAGDLQRQLRALPQVSETFIPEESGYPTLDIRVDRVKAARLGLNQRDVVTNVITALTSNQMIAPSIWIDPKSGNDYFLTAQYSESDINSLETLLNIPVRGSRPRSCAARRPAVAQCGEHQTRAASRRGRPLRHPARGGRAGSPRGDDLGGARAAVANVLQAYHFPPEVAVTIRGSVAAMEAAFRSFGFGLAMAVVLLYLVMVAQFRSFMDPFIIMFAVPMGLIGVIWTLILTGTTLNIESFMGIIVMVGIVVSNSILLVDFANQRRREGQELRRAVLESARIRMRPILMTALATIAGLMPIALTLGEGSEASAPLARAAVGGLAVSTVLTLILVPCVYELLYARRQPAAGEGASR